MLIVVDRNTTVLQLKDGSIQITRPNILGSVATYTMKTEYSAIDIAKFLEAREMGTESRLIQNVFPRMSDEDREFIMTGITPERWLKIFPPEKE